MPATGPPLGGALAEAPALLEPPALAEVPALLAGGVEPLTVVTEPATDSTFVPNHQARAMTTARARTGRPMTTSRRRAPGSSVSSAGSASSSE